MDAIDVPDPSGSPSALGAQTAAEIIALVREEGLAVGDRLTERGLAERLRVSRSPVRAALSLLQQQGYVHRTETGRYEVAMAAGELPAQVATDEDEELYLRIASDRLDGELPDRVSEAALSRRYGVSRAKLAPLLTRASSEGWAAPRPRQGWEFLGVLHSLSAYRDSYRFRLLVEPAAILEPTFVLDRAGLERRRAEQIELIEGRINTVGSREVFDLNASLHETIARCSGNEFIVESLVRINRLRRLVDYRQRLDPARALLRCHEHVRLVDLLLQGDLSAASALLRSHLEGATDEKTREARFRETP